jgi:hypothetical protein
VRYRWVAKVQQPPTRAVKTPPTTQLVNRTTPVKSSLINISADRVRNSSHVSLAALTKFFP